jgi:response regulator RpfG family c-di-GMP phosphodiesterase
MKPPSVESKPKPRVLCVDDEPNVLEGLTLNLGRRYDVETAGGGAAALELLQRDPQRSVIVSDMRMPGMDGATFLAKARTLAPDAVRMLLTGQTDIEAAIQAVNEGQIFRFLTKPCPPPALLAAIAAGVEQHELITSQRVLLEQTLHGSIKALTDVLSLTSPAAFGRATRIKQLVSELANQLGLQQRWQVEIAAMLSQLGHITLPHETAERLYFGQPLSADEQKLVEKLPAVTEQLLSGIPRLELVRAMLADYPRPFRGASRPAPADDLQYAGTQLLKLAVDFDVSESRRGGAAQAIEALRAHADQYDPGLLAALIALRGQRRADDVRETPLPQLVVGMVLAEDVKMTNGVLLAARGHEVSQRFLERVRNSPKGAIKDKLLIAVRSSSEATWWAAPTSR